MAVAPSSFGFIICATLPHSFFLISLLFFPSFSFHVCYSMRFLSLHVLPYSCNCLLASASRALYLSLSLSISLSRSHSPSLFISSSYLSSPSFPSFILCPLNFLASSCLSSGSKIVICQLFLLLLLFLCLIFIQISEKLKLNRAKYNANGNETASYPFSLRLCPSQCYLVLASSNDAFQADYFFYLNTILSVYFSLFVLCFSYNIYTKCPISLNMHVIICNICRLHISHCQQCMQ